MRRLVPPFREESLRRALASAGLAALADQDLVAQVGAPPSSGELLAGRDELLEVADALADGVEFASLGRVERSDASQALPVEIERKYLLRELPPHAEQATTPARIAQGYIPGEHIHERVRSWTPAKGAPKYTRTIKLGRGLSRVEVSEGLDADAFGRLWALTDGKRLSKSRYVVPEDDRVWEIDAFDDRSLVLAEVELEYESDEVVLPAWLAPFVVREVTEESEYVNVNLAR